MSLHEQIALRNPVLAQPAALNGLFSPYRLGELELPNRLVMSPMTRSRALDGNVPHPLAATYYAQRASAGLIVTEATQVSPQGVGYIRTPGMHSAEQVAGWKRIDEAVHRAGRGRGRLDPRRRETPLSLRWSATGQRYRRSRAEGTWRHQQSAKVADPSF